LWVQRAAVRAIRVYSISFASSSKNIFSKKQEHRRGRPLLYFEVCATRSGRRLPCLPTFRPDTAPKAVTDATHVGERCIEDLDRFLVVKALKHPNQFISIPWIKRYTGTANRQDSFSHVTPHVLDHSSVPSTRVLYCIGHAVLRYKPQHGRVAANLGKSPTLQSMLCPFVSKLRSVSMLRSSCFALIVVWRISVRHTLNNRSLSI
jgi:hypothetical protein